MNPHLPAELRRHLAVRPPDRSLLFRFAPSHTRGQRLAPPPADARPASVIVLLYPIDGAWQLPLVVRPGHLKHHQGQIALPGGAQEAGERLDATALRELGEELGIATSGVEMIGPLTPFFVPVSGFHVHPWVGWLPVAPCVCANPAEVDAVLNVPLAALVHPAALATERRELGGEPVDVPFFAVGQHKVWGATCIVLGELAMVCDGLEI